MRARRQFFNRSDSGHYEISREEVMKKIVKLSMARMEFFDSDGEFVRVTDKLFAVLRRV
jgi:hypothetical protein